MKLLREFRAGVELELDAGRLRVEFVTGRIARVRFTRAAEWTRMRSMMRVPVAGRPGRIEFKNARGWIELRARQLSVRIDRASSAVSFYAPDGQLLLTENPTAPRRLTRTAVMKSVPDANTLRSVRSADGERAVAREFTLRKDRDAWRGEVKFKFAAGEALYGLGCDETDDLNLRGKRKRLYQHNLHIVIPFIVSTRGYGLLFDAYCAMTWADGRGGGSMGFDVVEELDYYFIAPHDAQAMQRMDSAIAGYRELTGAASPLPAWSLGYVQSKERYKSQDEVVATLREFRRRRIPIDVIVQDWHYWRPGHWGSPEPDPKHYPDIARLAREVHKLRARLMISVWPNPSPKGKAGKELRESGAVLPGSTYADFFSRKGGEIYFKHIWKNLGRHGIDAWWCDSTEPEVFDWQERRPKNYDAANIAALEKIIDPQWLNAYALAGSKNVYEQARIAAPRRPFLNLTRSGYAGSQRYGTVLWTGDVTAKWKTLAQQVPALLNLSAAGHPYVTCDVGGFFVRKRKQWFWDGDYEAGVKDLGYRELYVRWLQLATFLPMMRSHGTDTPREPWRFGAPGTPFYEAIVAMIKLRYKLMPYLKELAGRVHQEGASFIRPLAFGFPNDLKTHDLKTQFILGDALMVCPVLRPMYYGVGSKPLSEISKARPVYLPGKGHWIDFWTGEVYRGGRTIKAAATLDCIPMYIQSDTKLKRSRGFQFLVHFANSHGGGT